jgi:hypothetical protein
VPLGFWKSHYGKVADTSARSIDWQDESFFFLFSRWNRSAKSPSITSSPSQPPPLSSSTSSWRTQSLWQRIWRPWSRTTRYEHFGQTKFFRDFVLWGSN